MEPKAHRALSRVITVSLASISAAATPNMGQLPPV